MNLIIFKNGQSSRNNCIIVQASTCPIVLYENSVFVYKSSAHYEGMVTNPEYNDSLITNIDGYHTLPDDDMVNYEMPIRALSHTYLPESYLSRVTNSRDINKSCNDIHLLWTSLAKWYSGQLLVIPMPLTVMLWTQVEIMCIVSPQKMSNFAHGICAACTITSGVMICWDHF